MGMSNECSPVAECVNTIGSYSCQCTQGYRGNGSYCLGMERKIILDLRIPFPSFVARRSARSGIFANIPEQAIDRVLFHVQLIFRSIEYIMSVTYAVKDFVPIY